MRQEHQLTEELQLGCIESELESFGRNEDFMKDPANAFFVAKAIEALNDYKAKASVKPDETDRLTHAAKTTGRKRQCTKLHSQVVTRMKEFDRRRLS